MTQKEIARVRLARGRVGYFDEKTRIHLTISRPEAVVYASMNTTNLKRAVHNGTLRLYSGSLEIEKAATPKDIHKEVTIQTKGEIEIAPEVAKVAKPVVETKAEVKEEVQPVVEEVKEEAAPEVEAEEQEAATEEAKATKARKPRTSKSE